MKAFISAVCLAAASLPALSFAQGIPSTATRDAAEQEIVDLSSRKWQWMSERNTAELDALFDEKSVFVHMGGAMTKAQELNVIKSGGIHYKKADVEDISVRFIGDTAIVLSKLRLRAVVGGNEVTNPFIVTEVYVKQSAEWKLGSLSFTRLLGS